MQVSVGEITSQSQGSVSIRAASPGWAKVLMRPYLHSLVQGRCCSREDRAAGRAAWLWSTLGLSPWVLVPYSDISFQAQGAGVTVHSGRT